MENKYKHLIDKKIEGKEWEEALNKSYLKNNKKAKIDGFRVGKAPFDIFVKHYGIETLYDDAINEVIQSAYDAVLTESKLLPIVRPSVDIKNISKEFVEFTFTIITKPEVKIKKYEGLKIKKESAQVTDKEIQAEINHLLEHYSELVIKEGEVALGDTVIIDYEGFVDGVAFEGGKSLNYSLEIGSGQFIPGFEDALIGMKKEETKEIKVTFPSDYHASELKGKEATFKVLVHEIKTKEKRELNEEFFEDLAMEGVNSLETLQASVKEHLESRKKVETENAFIDNLMDAISKHTEVSIPEEMVEDEIDNIIAKIEQNLKYQGATLELYYQITKTTEKDLRDNSEREAYKNVLYRLILEELINILQIKVTEEEINNEIQTTAQKYNTTEDKVKTEMGGIEMIEYDIKVKKAFDELTKLNEIK